MHQARVTQVVKAVVVEDGSSGLEPAMECALDDPNRIVGLMGIGGSAFPL